jgi:HD-like signal output (HDOD) protein
MPDILTHAEAVTDCVEEILKDGDFPALSRQIRDTLTALDDEGASMQRLANVVLQDYGLTLKVIHTANSFHYNRSGQPILSATQALILLGVTTTRDLASSLLLFEHYHRKSPWLKELMLLSMLTANQAGEAAERLHVEAPEQAYLSGMFRNLGEVLLACHRPAEYAALLEAVTDERKTPAQACLALLKFTYEDLGAAIANHWGMPPAVSQALRSGGAADSEDLGALVSFSHELTTAVYRDDSGQSPSAIARVFESYRDRLGLDRDNVTSILERAVLGTREAFFQAGIPVDDLRLWRQTRLALQVVRSLPSEMGFEPAGADAAGALARAGADAVAPSFEALRKGFVKDIAAALGNPHGVDLNQLLLMVLEGIYRGGPFDRAMFCLVNADRSVAQGRFGLGAGIDPLVAQFQFPMAASSADEPVARALIAGQDLWCSKAAGLTPDEAALAARFGADTFAVFPLIVQRRIVGCLYFDRRTNQPAPDEATWIFLRRLRDAAARAVGIARTTRAPIREGARARKVIAPETRSQSVLRVLRGEAAEAVSADVGVTVAEVERWRRNFLAGALAGLSEMVKKEF